MRIATLSVTLLCLALSATAFAATELYNDGPTDGTTNAFFIDGPGGTFGQQISDGFLASASGNATSFDFVEWVSAGSTPSTLTWNLGTSPLGSELSSGSGFASSTLLCTNGSNFNGGICAGGFGFDVYQIHVDGLSGSLTAGDQYWLTLGGAFDSFGGSDAWDVNNGPAICDFAVGGVLIGDCGAGGESFTINGGGTTTPEPSSIMLLGSGMLGLAGVLRRKLSR